LAQFALAVQVRVPAERQQPQCNAFAVQTNLTTYSATQFAFTIPAQPTFHHIVVFVLPGSVLPPDTAAAVYIQLPNESGFSLLGAISNEKPSAIFRINNPVAAALSQDEDAMVDESAPTPTSLTGTGDIILGISIEPAVEVSQQLALLKSARVQSPVEPAPSMALATRPPSTKLLAQRIIRNAFNFLASFAGGSGDNEVVPLRSFQDWWVKFEKKIELDPGFLERDDDG
jgi:protein Hikeshi